MAQAIRPVTMPKWGIEMTEGTINQWTIREGQQVEKGEPLLEVETEKIVNTVESPAAGTLRRIVACAGDVKPVGSLIAVLADEDVSDAEITFFIDSFKGATVSFEPDAEGASAGGATADESQLSADEPRISPIARRLAEKLGIDISQVKGTGRNGRIGKEDVEAYAARLDVMAGGDGTTAGSVAAVAPGASTMQANAGSVAALAPDASVAEANPFKRLKLSATRATIARRLLESKLAIPHYRLTIEVDVERLQQHRRALPSQPRISLNDMLLRACALALVRHPTLNAQFAGEEILQFEHADVAVAVASESGLITPIVRAADRKSLQQVASESGDLAERARRGSLTKPEINGGTFTLSNLGMYGVTSFDAIINPPQVAILAVGAARAGVVVRNGAPAVTQLITLTLSADHRVVDGAEGAAFLATLKDLLQAPDRL